MKSADVSEKWPALPLEAWKDTRDTLHMWTQIVGKIRLRLRSVPYRKAFPNTGRAFQFVDHRDGVILN